jgi:predicted peroxiredoxin
VSNKFCVSITASKSNGDMATVGFVVANAALGSEKETLVFLSADGVWAAVKGEMEQIDEGAPFAPLAELVGKFTKAGGRILVCAPCLKKRGIEEGQLVEGAAPAGGAALVEFLSDGTPCVTY